MNEGIYKKDNKFIFDYSNDNENDIIHLTFPILKKFSLLDNVYWFGYEFSDTASSKDRREFIDYLKGVSDDKIPEKELVKFIDRPLVQLSREYDLTDISCIVSPKSERSDLVKHILIELGNVFPHGISGLSYEVIKNIPSLIQFDWKRFDDEFDGDEHSYNQIRDYIEGTLMPKIKDLSYFSLAKNVKTRYRRYIMDFLIVPEELQKALISMQQGKILLIDDINTSSSTLYENNKIDS